MNRIKILFIIGTYGVGGKERQLAELIQGLPKSRYSVSFIVKNGDAYYLKNLEKDLDHYYSLEENKFGFRSLFKIYRKIEYLKPDIVHSWSSLATFQAIFIRLFLNFRLIDGSIRDSIPPNFITKIIKTVINLFADRIITNSKAGLICYKIPDTKSTFIYNGFNFNRIIYLDPIETIRDTFKINSPKIVGMVARIDYQKDYPTFIKAAIIILLKRNDVRFVIVGDGEDKEKIQSLIASEHKEKFIFTSKQPNVESIINCFDVGVLATFKEGISNSILEYMALGKPVVATDGGGMTELIEDGVTGYLVKEGDEKQLASKIQFLLENPDTCEIFGIAGKKYILENFSYDKMINRFQDEYENILKY